VPTNSNKFDWRDILEHEIERRPELQYLLQKRFFGKLVVNFQARPVCINLEQTFLTEQEEQRRRDLRARRSNSRYPEGYGDINNTQTNGFVAEEEGQ
jgi:hypothetical protein